MYYYILGCGIACLVLFGINSMDTPQQGAEG